MAAPFMVLATQNPVEQEGTYRLPEAQLDRFLFKIIVPYPQETEEMTILTPISSMGNTKATGYDQHRYWRATGDRLAATDQNADH